MTYASSYVHMETFSKIYMTILKFDEVLIIQLHEVQILTDLLMVRKYI